MLWVISFAELGQQHLRKAQQFITVSLWLYSQHQRAAQIKQHLYIHPVKSLYSTFRATGLLEAWSNFDFSRFTI